MHEMLQKPEKEGFSQKNTRVKSPFDLQQDSRLQQSPG
jgi:hypothetical protein